MSVKCYNTYVKILQTFHLLFAIERNCVSFFSDFAIDCSFHPVYFSIHLKLIVVSCLSFDVAPLHYHQMIESATVNVCRLEMFIITA